MKQYKIKKETVNNSTGEAYGLTVPREIYEKFKDSKFTIFLTEDMIIYKSGIDLKVLQEQVNKFTFRQIEVLSGEAQNIMA